MSGSNVPKNFAFQLVGLFGRQFSAGNALRLRIYWDARKDPGVDVPLGDFFAVGQGTPAVVESAPIQVSPTGALTSYWRMPFAKSLPQ